MIPRKLNNKIDWKILIIGKDWKSFLVWTMLTISILLMAYGYKHDNEELLKVYTNPCDYCGLCKYVGNNDYNKLNNISMDIIRPYYGEKENNKTGEANSS